MPRIIVTADPGARLGALPQQTPVLLDELVDLQIVVGDDALQLLEWHLLGIDLFGIDGFEEFQRSAHVEVVIQHLLFVCTQRAGVGFAREFPYTLGVDIRQTQPQQLTRSRGRQVADFGPDGSTPDFGFGCSSNRFHTPCS